MVCFLPLVFLRLPVGGRWYKFGVVFSVDFFFLGTLFEVYFWVVNLILRKNTDL